MQPLHPYGAGHLLVGQQGGPDRRTNSAQKPRHNGQFAPPPQAVLRQFVLAALCARLFGQLLGQGRKGVARILRLRRPVALTLLPLCLYGNQAFHHGALAGLERIHIVLQPIQTAGVAVHNQAQVILSRAGGCALCFGHLYLSGHKKTASAGGMFCQSDTEPYVAAVLVVITSVGWAGRAVLVVSVPLAMAAMACT
ncbi:hypothetical protein [Acetobacter ghanensis]|uniref:hypothetical protein n=1 Tax=Acetobacter ghanensis TaxID=431306 RepID=UPI0018D2CEBE|nr:hypothetical protein [Acetobacter ghanensis]